MTIGQAAKAAGVSSSTIRFYEGLGLLPRPPRKSGIRDYDPSIVTQLTVLRFYRAAGMSIGDIAAMVNANRTDDDAADSRVIVRQRIAKLDALIEEARAMKRRLHDLLNCDCGGNREMCVIFTQKLA